MPASRAAGISWTRRILSVASSFFSPGGLVLGKMGDSVVVYSTVCSSRKLQRQSMIAL